MAPTYYMLVRRAFLRHTPPWAGGGEAVGGQNHPSPAAPCLQVLDREQFRAAAWRAAKGTEGGDIRKLAEYYQKIGL